MNYQKKKKLIILIACTICLIIGIFAFSKHVKHERSQSNVIHNLSLKINKLESELEFANLMIDKLNMKIETANIQYSENGFNYLAIGNSITKHGKCSYWWNEIGMAATEEKNDYFHLVSDFLIDKHKDFCSMAVNYSIWETNANDRSQTFNMIDPYLSDKLDLVTIQLSENVSDLSTFHSDFTELISHIKEKCPSVEIVIIDDFWSIEKANIKKNIALTNNIVFVDLDEIRNKQEYQCGMHTVVYGDDGNAYNVEHEGVSKHPNDKAMKFIADAIIKKIKF